MAVRTACQMSASPTRASPGLLTPGSYPATVGLRAIRASGYGPAGRWRRPQSPASMTRTHPEPRLPDNINRTDQAHHASSAPPSGAPLPRYGRRTARQATWQRTKIPTPHVPHKPRQHRADAVAFTHLSWSEAELVSSRDRTRTYNLPVNRGSAIGPGAAAPLSWPATSPA